MSVDYYGRMRFKPVLVPLLLSLAFGLKLFVAHELAGSFLDLALHFFQAALNLVFVRGHDLLLNRYECLWMFGPAAASRQYVQIRHQGPDRALPYR